MAELDIAAVYGQALLDTAVRRQVDAQVWREVQEVLPFLERRQPLRHLLEVPQISPTDKKALLTRVFGERMQPLLLDFMHMLLDKFREGALADCLRYYHQRAQERLGLTAGQVVTAHALDEPLRQRLQARLETVTGRSFQMEWRVDPDLLGGVVVRYGDVLLDGSLSSRLRKLERQLLETILPASID